MATLTVYIGETSPATYFPTYPLVRPGDTVTFTLVDRRDEVKVDFGADSPFMVYHLTIDGPNLTSSAPQTIRSTASSGRYNFSAYPVSSLSDPKVDPEPPGTVTGGLEVTTEPSTPPDDR